MKLSERTIKKIKSQPGLIIPEKELFALPEKVLQFGTGVLLRGLSDYFIDKANRHGFFNGRIVVVKSTSQGSADEFDKQDGLYTLCVRGIENDAMKEEEIINSSISRVLAASEDWDKILKCAYDPEMKIIISNTTEVGIMLTEDDIRLSPPASFPGKLLAFLYERYKAFYGREDSGMVIIPTELIADNGDKLRSIVIELAGMNKLDAAFFQWLQSANHFCNSLVDRIVPGKLSPADKKTTEEKLGYTDELMIMAETFRLWAIESASQRVKELLSFSIADDGVVIAPDIEKFRELKLRLLNGTHTFSCGLAHLAGFTTVKEAMQNEAFSSYMHRLMMLEIATVLDNEGKITYNEACAFAGDVMDRFRNPFLDHLWLSISTNYTSKMKLRNIPLLLKHYSHFNQVPENMALGFAAYLLFMKCNTGKNGGYYGNANGKFYPVQDDMAKFFEEKNRDDINNFVDCILANKNLWGADISKLNNFADAVKENMQLIEKKGVLETLAVKQVKKTVA
ncbi:MAG TPA: tagaturonate reductase [Chitinophagaceae bacterium]|nr:tagaturonate reductase [Chitinophagaceae bacterium]